MAELSDEEVFGTPKPVGPRELSDADVFGAPAPAPAASAGELSDAAVGLNPGAMDYVTQTGSALGRGFVESTVVAPLHGIGGMASVPDIGAREQAWQRLLEGGDLNDPQVTRVAASDEPPRAKNVQEHPAYKLGTSISQATSEALPDTNILNPVFKDVAQGFGSLGGNLTMAMIPGVRNLTPGHMLLQGAGEAAERAIKNPQATQDQINRAAMLGNIAGATEMGDLLLLNLGTTGKALGFLRKMGERFVKGAFIEGGQEGLQQFIQNAISKGVYNPKQDLTEDVAYNAMIGALVGGPAGMVLGGHEGTAPSTPVQPGTLEQAVAPPQVDTNLPAIPLVEPQIPPAPVAPAEAASPASTAPTAPVEPTPTPTPAVPIDPAKTVNPKVSTFIDQQVEASDPEAFKLPTNPEQLTLTDLLAPQKEEIEAKPGVNTGRLAKLLGAKLYGNHSQISPVSVKELVQNSFDGIKGLLERKTMDEGNIDITMDPVKRSITVRDDGAGMSLDTLANKFFQIGGTQKDSKRASGGLGIAKMLFLFENKALRVTTMRDGKVAEVYTTGEAVFNALNGDGEAPKISVRQPNANDQRIFPKGHGTSIEVVVPESYIDSSTGATKPVHFYPDLPWHDVLRRSPLFDNINVRFNGDILPIGKEFPLEDFVPLASVNSDWGTARIYVSRQPDILHDGAHILSNGLWQFSQPIYDWNNKAIPYRVYIDLNPKVAAEDAGYPFDLNRQRFSPTVEKEFQNLFRYIGLLYSQADLRQSAENFGTMQFLDWDVDTEGVTASENFKIEPKAPPVDTPLQQIRPGDKITMQDGKMLVNGRAVPELTPELIAKYRVNPDELRVPQEEIDPKRVILHDNVVIKVSESETRTVTDYGREKFGRRFDEFVFAVGAKFMELRAVVVRDMSQLMYAKTPTLRKPPTDPFEQVPFNQGDFNEYTALGKEGIGISFDVQYRGVSIKLPFSAMFINPVVPIFGDPVRAALGVTSTMIHEMSHFLHRNHNAGFRDEMVKIQIMLESHPEFSLNKFKQSMVDIYAAYDDVHSHLRGVFTSGDFNISPRGKRFKDSSLDETRDGSVLSDASGLGALSESGERLSDWVEKGSAIPEGEQGRSDPAYETKRSGNNRPADNGRARNYNAFKSIDPGITAPPQQPEVNALRSRVQTVLGGVLPPEVKEAAAHADRFNWFYKYVAGVMELLDANPYFTPLRKYVERVRLMHNDETKVHDAALRILQDWGDLGDRGKNLENLIYDVQAMPYLSPDAQKMQLWRHPTPAEFDVLVKKNNVDEETLRVYNKIRSIDETYLRLVEANAVEAATRNIKDPVKLAARLDEIAAVGRLARAQPFFPFTRFGRHYVLVKDAAGKPIHFETFEEKRVGPVRVKSAEKYQQARENEIRRKLGPGETVTSGVLPETAGPLIGMPTVLLQLAQGENLGFTEDMVKAMQLIQTNRNPALALKDRAKYAVKDDPKTYSLDLKRSFARYYFFGGRYFAKTKHLWALRGHIGEAQMVPGNKSGLITSYMADHLQHTIVDTRGDFGWFKAPIFLWAMGYVPAAATQNLTQTPMVTFPVLAGKFGPVQASRALVRAMTQVSNFYRRGTYDTMTGFEYDAISYGIKTGRISETQAPELAGIASGNNLIRGYGGNKLEQGAIAFQEKAAWMFEMAEQYNRRVAFRAALELAQKNPKAKYVQESVQKYNDEYQQLAKQFKDETKAAAIVTAIHAIDQSQFVYAKYARPRIMRGGLGAVLFVFKRYMQSLLFMLGHNKSDVLPYYLVMAMLFGGLGGVPGWDDFRSLFRAFGKWFFGKDADPEKMVRQYVLQWFGKDSVVQPDLVLHGLSRRGFGLPGLMDAAGSLFTGNPGRGLGYGPNVNVPVPILDRSKAITLGNLLPFDLGKMMEPTDKLDRTISDQTQKASGAVFSVGFNIYKAIMDSDSPATDWKRWEKAMPRALSSASRSYRAFSEERERGARGGPNSGATIVPYNIWENRTWRVRETEHMFEALAMLGGYQPLRQQAKWDQIIAKAEAEAFLKLRQQGLLQEYFEAMKGQNSQERDKILAEIRQYNRDLPEYAKGYAISAETAQKSMRMRERALQSRESGIPMQRRNQPVSNYINSLYPEAQIDVRRVK